MKRVIIIAVTFWLCMPALIAQQLDVSAEVRPRFETRHGFKKLIAPDESAANFVSQRTRLNFDFQMEKITLGMSIQNVRVWGDAKTMNTADKGISFHQAWAQLQLHEKLLVKFGRQEIAYDDQRIFGSVGWAQQARSHDAMIIKFIPNDNHRVDLGFAYNSDQEYLTDSLYSNIAGYKTFQYGWYHGKFNDFSLSFLLLNTGVEYVDSVSTTKAKNRTDFFQTFGPRITYKKNKVTANAAAYFQTGEHSGSTVMASYFDANVSLKFQEHFSFGLGGAYLSGRDMNSTNSDLVSFNPIFGTNHKFNGWMDYFYVGNHQNSVGLIDLNATLTFTKNKFEAKFIPHFFQSDGVIIDEKGGEMDKQLGTELDFAVGYKIAKYANIKAGYSQMLATESMEILKGGSKDESNHWAWVMITINPSLFSTKFKEDK